MDLLVVLEIFTAVTAAIIALGIWRNKKDHELKDEISRLWDENRALRMEIKALREELRGYREGTK